MHIYDLKREPETVKYILYGEKLMKKEIPFIDIADVNCWMVYLMPLTQDQRSNYELTDSIQQACIHDKVFGMGWDVEVPGFSKETPMTDENALKYVKTYNCGGYKVSDAAVNGYKEVKKGDYAIARNKNGHYYVGKVSSEGAHYLYDAGKTLYRNFSWGCEVEEWVEFATEEEVPSEIIGRFSQRIHSTIQKILPYRQRLLVIAMYENHIDKSRKVYEIPKLHIGKSNFVRSMNYKELEDIVSVYMADKHCRDGYYLLPSSCKVSQQNYEFTFVSSNKKPITCQVKNQQKIEISHYKNETGYERIYIFSGKWDDLRVEELRKEYATYQHIYIISPSELYETLKSNMFLKNEYYDHQDKDMSTKELIPEGYTVCKKPKREYECSMDEDFICFERKDGLFYSREFDALVLSYHIFQDTKSEKEVIERIKRDINPK